MSLSEEHCWNDINLKGRSLSVPVYAGIYWTVSAKQITGFLIERMTLLEKSKGVLHLNGLQ